VVGSIAVLRLSFCAKNPPLRQAAKRYQQSKISHYHFDSLVQADKFSFIDNFGEHLIKESTR